MGAQRAVGSCHMDEGSFTGAGSGPRIAWRAWRPDGPPTATLVLAHGAGEHAGRYGHLVDRLVPAGIAVHALDHRGHGRSEGPRAVVDRLQHAADDVGTLVDLARQPEVPLFLMGHSMGAPIALLHALGRPQGLAGLVLSAPALTLGSGPLPLRLLARTRVVPLLLSALRPELGMLQLDAAGISRDPAAVAAYEADPLVFHGPLPARTTVEIAEFILTRFPREMERLLLPLLVLHGEADPITPHVAAVDAHRLAGSIDKTLSLHPGAFHELHNELPATRDAALGELLAWIQARA